MNTGYTLKTIFTIATLLFLQNWESSTVFTVNCDFSDTKCLTHLLRHSQSFQFYNIFSYDLRNRVKLPSKLY